MKEFILDNWLCLLASMIVTIGGVIAIIIWYKKINPDTTWIYSIYVVNVLIIGNYLLLNRIFT